MMVGSSACRTQRQRWTASTSPPAGSAVTRPYSSRVSPPSPLRIEQRWWRMCHRPHPPCAIPRVGSRNLAISTNSLRQLFAVRQEGENSSPPSEQDPATMHTYENIYYRSVLTL